MKSKRNRHTGRINASKRQILEATVPLNPGKGIAQEYVTEVIGGKTYKGLRTIVRNWKDMEGVTRDTVTLVRA